MHTCILQIQIKYNTVVAKSLNSSDFIKLSKTYTLPIKFLLMQINHGIRNWKKNKRYFFTRFFVWMMLNILYGRLWRPESPRSCWAWIDTIFGNPQKLFPESTLGATVASGRLLMLDCACLLVVWLKPNNSPSALNLGMILAMALKLQCPLTQATFANFAWWHEASSC